MKTTHSILLRSAATVLCAGLALSSLAQNPAPAQLPISQIEEAIKRAPLDLKLRLELGFAYVNKDDFPHALEAFQEAVKLGPTSAEAHNWMGVALMEKSDLPGAVAELRKAVSLDPKYARAYTNLGSALARSGDISEAVTVFQKALVLEPNSVPAHLNLALALREKGDLQAALLHLRRVENADPKNAMIQYEFGQTLRQSGDLGSAIAAFEKAIEINPEMQEAYYGLGLALKQQGTAAGKPLSPTSPADEDYRKAQESLGKGDLNAARELLLNAVRADEHNAEAHNLLGYILGQQGDLSFAINHLERAVQLKPDYADAHYNLGVALWYNGTKDKSISELRESVRLDPAAGASYAFLGMALRETDDLAGARVNLQRAIALLPPTTATYVDLGTVYLRMGQLDRGLGQFEAGLNAPPSPPTADWDSAIAGLRQALVKDPKRADAHNMLGLLLGRKGADSNEVLAEFREAIRLRPDFAAAHNNIGLVLTQSDDDDAAIAEFREAIRIRPDFADAHANLGATLTSTDVEQAIVELEKAVSLDPTSVKAQFNLAVAYGGSSTRDAGKEIEQLRKVISLSPTFARAHLALGKALIEEGNPPEAVNELREAAKLEPQSGEAHYQLGLALARAGKRDEGAGEVRKGQELSAADERNQNAKLDISEARTALNNGEIEEAVTKLRHAVKLAPESAEAQHFLGVALEKQGDVSGASTAYQKATDLNPGDSIARKNLERLSLPDSPLPSAHVESSEDEPAKIAEFERYIRENRFQEVEPLLADYVKQHPNSSWGWYALGYSYFAEKKLGESIQALAKSLQLDIKNPEAHKILGRDLMMIGKFDAAQTEFEQGIRYDPKSAELHYNLGKLFSIQDNWENARKQFEEALRVDPSHIESLDALGLAQEALGDDAGAVASYNKAIALNEEHHGNFFAPDVNLSAYYNRTGDSAKAMEFAQKALDLDPKSDKAWFQKARAEEHEGKLQDAADSLNRAISFNERASSYYYVLAGVYRRLGKTTDSQKALESFTRLDRENNELEKMRRSMSKSNGASATGGERE